MKKYRFVYDVPRGRGFGWKLFTADEFMAEMKEMGHTSTKVATGHHLHADLIGEPIFPDLVGPMRDGVEDGMPVIRYETASVAALFSRD